MKRVMWRGLLLAAIATAAGMVLQCASDPSMTGDGGVIDGWLADLGLRDGPRDARRRDGIGPKADAATDLGTKDCTCAVTVKAPQIGYKGLTAIKRNGAGGIATFNADCHKAFPGSRICRVRDVVESYPAPTPAQQAWLLAVPVASLNGSVTLANGDVANPDKLNCRSSLLSSKPSFSYADSSARAKTLGTDGAIINASCDSALVVACCARE